MANAGTQNASRIEIRVAVSAREDDDAWRSSHASSSLSVNTKVDAHAQIIQHSPSPNGTASFPR